MPKFIRTPRRKYINHGPSDGSWKTMSMLADYGLLKRDESTFFLESPYLRELYELVHTNMLFNWLSGDYGPIDDANVKMEDIEKVWRQVAHDHGYFSRGGCVMQFYCDKEFKFFVDLKSK